jgi:short subunit dehydrogenase
MKTWFITGASRGFGRIWAEAALLRGDKVAATARKSADFADLTERFGEAVLPLALDVTNAEQVRQTVAQAHQHFGRLDVILNNAGYTLIGTVEEASEADVRALFDTNYFWMLRVVQAALPLLRQQGGGNILGVSSGMGIVAVRWSASTAPRMDGRSVPRKSRARGQGLWHQGDPDRARRLCHGICEPLFGEEGGGNGSGIFPCGQRLAGSIPSCVTRKASAKTSNAAPLSSLDSRAEILASSSLNEFTTYRPWATNSSGDAWEPVFHICVLEKAPSIRQQPKSHFM